jgi:uncharacterized membrane protein YvbJ
MPYCRTCGAKLEENARYCTKCGTPAAIQISPPPPPLSAPSARPFPKESQIILIAVVLVSVFVVALIAIMIFAGPIFSMNYNQTNPGYQNINFVTSFRYL